MFIYTTGVLLKICIRNVETNNSNNNGSQFWSPCLTHMCMYKSTQNHFKDITLFLIFYHSQELLHDSQVAWMSISKMKAILKSCKKYSKTNQSAINSSSVQPFHIIRVRCCWKHWEDKENKFTLNNLPKYMFSRNFTNISISS